MNLLNKLLKLIFTLLFLFTPLLMYPYTSELFEFNKIIFIYLTTICAVFLWILKMIIGNKFEIKRSFLDYPLILFYISQVISTIFSIDVHTSLFGYYGRFNGGLLSITAYISLYYVFISNFDKDFVIKLLKVSLISSMVVILWGLPGKFGYDLSCLVFVKEFNNSCWTNQFHPELRMFSTLGQPNWLGAYLAINLFIAFFFYLKSVEKRKLITVLLYLIYLLFNVSAILFTRSRSSYLAVGIGFLIFFFIYVLKSGLNDFFKKTAVFFVGIVILIFVIKTGVTNIDNKLVFINYKDTKLSQVKVKPKDEKEIINITESFDIRKVVWEGAVNLGLKYPLFGSGVETFAYAYYFTRPIEHNLTSEWDYLYNKAHNEYLNYFATTGFIGLLSYLLLLAVVIFNFQFSCLAGRQAIFNKNSKFKIPNSLLEVSIFIAWITILITNFFGFSVTTINLFFYLLPAMMVVLISKDNKVWALKVKINKQILILFTTSISIYFVFSTFMYWLADTRYELSNKYAQAGDYKTASQLLVQTIELRTEHVYQDKLSYLIANLVAYSTDEKQIAKLIKLSQDYNNESLKASSNNVLYLRTKAKDQYLFYSATLNLDYIKTGVEALNQSLKLSPTDPKNYYSLAIYYSILFDDEKDAQKKFNYKNLAIINMNKMMKLKPDYMDGANLQKQLLEKFQK